MDIQNISNHFPFIYKPTQEIHYKQVPNTTLINNNCLKVQTNVLCGFSRLAIDQEYPQE